MRVTELLAARSALALVDVGPDTRMKRLLPCASWFMGAGAGASDAATALAPTLNSIGSTDLLAMSPWNSIRARTAGGVQRGSATEE